MMDCNLDSQFVKPPDNLKQMPFPLEGWWMVSEKVRGSRKFHKSRSLFFWVIPNISQPHFLAEPFWGFKLSLAIQKLKKSCRLTVFHFPFTTSTWIYFSQSNKLQFCKLFLEIDKIQPQAYCYGAILVVTITFTSWFGWRLIANNMFCSKYST